MKYMKHGWMLCWLIVLIGVSGCMFQKTDPTEEMLQYMEEKYGETFTYLSSSDVGGLFPKSSACFVRSEQYPDDRIRVGKTMTDNGYIFQDNYVAVIYRQQMREAVETAIHAAFGTRAKGEYVPSDRFLSENLDRDATFEMYGQCLADLQVWVNATEPFDRDADVEAMVAALRTQGVFGHIRLFYVDADEFEKPMETLHKNYTRNADRHYITYGIIYMTKSLTTKEVTWEEGEEEK